MKRARGKSVAETSREAAQALPFQPTTQDSPYFDRLYGGPYLHQPPPTSAHLEPSQPTSPEGVRRGLRLAEIGPGSSETVDDFTQSPTTGWLMTDQQKCDACPRVVLLLGSTVKGRLCASCWYALGEPGPALASPAQLRAVELAWAHVR